MAKREIKTITGGTKSFREEKGYTRAGGILKSKDTKDELEKKQGRINQFSARDNKQVAATLNRNTATPTPDQINDYGMYKGDQKVKKYRRSSGAENPKFRKSK